MVIRHPQTPRPLLLAPNPRPGQLSCLTRSPMANCCHRRRTLPLAPPSLFASTALPSPPPLKVVAQLRVGRVWTPPVVFPTTLPSAPASSADSCPVFDHLAKGTWTPPPVVVCLVSWLDDILLKMVFDDCSEIFCLYSAFSSDSNYTSCMCKNCNPSLIYMPQSDWLFDYNRNPSSD